MRKSNDQSLKQVLQDMIKRYDLQSGLNNAKIINLWNNTLGKEVSLQTKKLTIKNNKLYVTIQSSALASELFAVKLEIIEKLNQKIGDNYLKDIIFQ